MSCKKLLAAFALYGAANAQLVQQAKLSTADFTFYGPVALSGDGNTAFVSGLGVWSRHGRTWTRQSVPFYTCCVGFALSGDGNTALIGNVVWVRNGTGWTQQGPPLVPSDLSNGQNPFYGSSHALSGDGNTAFIGAADDSGGIGAAWVFTRDGTTWTQQGPKMVGTGAVGFASQGATVALSADGNTAVVGGPFDNSNTGAVWVWTRSGGTWTQQGQKLVANDSTGAAQQGYSIALSADGNTAIVGGPQDNPINMQYAGAAWAWTRTGSTWTQQGPKLVVPSTAGQGYSVALSADGNTALVGAPLTGPPSMIYGLGFEFYTGGVLTWTRSAGMWSYRSPLLLGTGASNPAEQGYFVALSSDASTAIWSGPTDSAICSNLHSCDGRGSAWVFSGVLGPPPTPADFDGNHVPDIVLQFPDGSMGLWSLTANGRQLSISDFAFMAGPSMGIALVGIGDLNGDNIPDLILRFPDGSVGVWYMGPLGHSIQGFAFIHGPIQGWVPVGVADVNSDGHPDLLIQYSDQTPGVWFLGGQGGNQITGFSPLSGPIPGWKVVGAADLNNDGQPDIILQYTDGSVGVWYMTGSQGTQISSFAVIAGPSTWSVVGVADMDADGHPDLIIRNVDGTLGVWYLAGAGGNLITAFTPITTPGHLDWLELTAH